MNWINLFVLLIDLHVSNSKGKSLNSEGNKCIPAHICRHVDFQRNEVSKLKYSINKRARRDKQYFKLIKLPLFVLSFSLYIS